MYRYTDSDRALVHERVAQFRDQVRRRLSGDLSEDEFRQLRLMNGLYMQRHAYMLRVAIPYGLLRSEQLRALAGIARDFDRGYGHFTTRMNIQYNWMRLEDVPDVLARLAAVEMHAIQTSGNCVRNITSDPLAGIASDEVCDPRPYCELLRQWSTFHPEFSFLPRKFKIAVIGSETDRAALAIHDLAFRIRRNADGEIGVQVLVGGGLGRTPILAKPLFEFVPRRDMLSCAEAILRVYNLHGNRKQPFQARIKILVKSLGIGEFRQRVETEWARLDRNAMAVPDSEFRRLEAAFLSPDYLPDLPSPGDAELAGDDAALAAWLRRNTRPHRAPGYRVAIVSLKKPGVAPGDATAEQMELLAELADRFSFGEIRTTHDQNLLLGDVEATMLPALHAELAAHGLATPNVGTLQDLICCPGFDFCSLANATSLPVAKAIQERFDDADYLYDLGEVRLKMSGCINSCGHHHVGHIGILGIDKKGEEFYQIMLGGDVGATDSLGAWIGPAVPRSQVPDAIDCILRVYVERRLTNEPFIETVRRLGLGPFRESVYADSSAA